MFLNQPLTPRVKIDSVLSNILRDLLGFSNIELNTSPPEEFSK